MTNTQHDAVADRIATRILGVINAHCPPPKGTSCQACHGEGATEEPDGLAFCSCEAGKIARRRQAIMNRMIYQGGAGARKAEKDRVLPKEYNPKNDPDHPMNKLGWL